MSYLHEVHREVRFIENEMLVSRGWGKGDGDLVFNGYTIPVWEDEKISGMDSGKG